MEGKLVTGLKQKKDVTFCSTEVVSKTKLYRTLVINWADGLPISVSQLTTSPYAPEPHRQCQKQTKQKPHPNTSSCATTPDIRHDTVATLTWGLRDQYNWETYPKQRRGVSPVALSYGFKTQVSSLHQGKWSLPKCLKWHQLFLQRAFTSVTTLLTSSSKATRELPAPLGTALSVQVFKPWT